jgi:hypothetical protein
MGNEVVAQLNKLKEKWDNPETEIEFNGNVTVGTNIPHTDVNGVTHKGGGINKLPLTDDQITKITNQPHGSKDAPHTYLPSDYIDGHLSKFDEGAVFFGPKGNSNYPNNSQDDNRFIMPKSEADDLIARTGGDISLIEKELGIPEGNWQSAAAETGGLMRVDIPSNVIKSKNLRMATGNEYAADEELWRPGGYTYSPNQTKPWSEAVINSMSWTDIPEEWRKLVNFGG